MSILYILTIVLNIFMYSEDKIFRVDSQDINVKYDYDLSGKKVLGYLEDPCKLEALNDGTFVILDQGVDKVFKYSLQGKLLNSWGGKKTVTKGSFIQPQALAVSDSGKIYVADYGRSFIDIFDQQGKRLKGVADYFSTVSFSVDRSENIYISAFDKYTDVPEENLCRVLHSDGRLVKGIANKEVIMLYPEMIETGYHSALYTENGNIILVANKFPVYFVFSKEGKLLSHTIVQDDRYVKKWEKYRNTNGVANYHYRIGIPIYSKVVYYDGNIYASRNVESGKKEILKIDSNGNIVKKIMLNTKHEKEYLVWSFDIIEYSGSIYLITSSSVPTARITVSKYELGKL